MINGKGDVPRPMTITEEVYGKNWNNIFTNLVKPEPKTDTRLYDLPEKYDKSTVVEFYGCSDDHIGVIITSWNKDEKLKKEELEFHTYDPLTLFIEELGQNLEIKPFYNGYWSFAIAPDFNSDKEDEIKFHDNIEISREYRTRKSYSETLIVSIWETNKVKVGSDCDE
jgi:hypothetical protein